MRLVRMICCERTGRTSETECFPLRQSGIAPRGWGSRYICEVRYFGAFFYGMIIKMRKGFLLAGVCFLIAGGGVAQPGPDTLRIDLKSVLQETILISPDVQAARSDADWAAARYDLARSYRILPNATISSALSAVPGVKNPNQTSHDQLYLDPVVRNDYGNLRPYAQMEISLIQPIHTWGANRAITAAAAGAELENARADETALEAALRAAELYYNVLLTNELHRLTDRAGDVVNMAIEEIDRLLKEGNPDVDDADRYQVLITQQEYQRRIVEVRQERQTASAALRRQLLAADSVRIVPMRDALEPLQFALESLEFYQQTALMYRPEIHQAKAGQAATRALIRAARAGYYPQIVFGLTLSASGASNRFRQPNPYVSDSFRRSRIQTGIGLRQTLNFGETRARVAQARARHASAEHLAVGAEQTVLAELEQAWRHVIIQEAALAAQDSSLAVSKEWLRVEQINFDLDLGDTENLVDAVQVNLVMEAGYYEAVRRYNMAVLKLLAAAGLLVREMNLFTE